MKYLRKPKKLPLPGWVFVVWTVLYNELMLHVWITDSFLPGRVLAIAAFALGLGFALAFLISLFPRKAAKGLTLAVSVFVTVLWVMEYFLSDAYQVFMTPLTIVTGAGGVAQDYFDLVVSLLVRNLWRIGLMLLPIVVYALCCEEPEKWSWKHRAMLAGLAVGGYLLGFGATNLLTNDAARLGADYNFDSTTRSLGLNMALTLEVATQGGESSEEPVFEATPTLPPETEPEVTGTEEAPEQTQPQIVYDDNVMDGVDFAQLAKEEKNAHIAALHEYVDAQKPSKQNAYTGLFAGKNLILITAEAFTAEVIDPERTPTLYRLANEGIKFTDYYQPAWGASTTSGEFSNVVGLIPTNGGACMKESYQQDLFITMGNQLQDLGYYSLAYHNHLKDFYSRDLTHTGLGYSEFRARYGGLEGISEVWPESDLEMIDISVPQYIDKQPFSIYYMTVSAHSVYTQGGHAMAKKNYSVVEDLDCSEPIKCYLAANMELEYAMESLLRQLEEADILDDTVIVMATDHYPYGLEKSSTWKNSVDYLSEFFGEKCDTCFVRDHNALIIWSGCIEDMDIQVDEPVFSLDILPTLSNLFGLDYDSRLLVGRDVFSDQSPLVFWPDSSWKTDKGTYNALSGKYIAADGTEMDKTYTDYIAAQIRNKRTYCSSVLNLDYFNYLSKALNAGEEAK